MELRGRRIVEAGGVLWHSVEGRLYRSIPPEIEIDVNPSDLDKMLRATGALGALFPSKNRPGLPSGLYVCRDRGYNLSSVQARLRSKVRRGLERCEVRPVQPSELLEKGLKLNLDTMKRQGRYDPEFGEPGQWKRLVAAAGQSAAIGTLGAFVKGRLAAYAITYREGSWYTIMHQMSSDDELENYPNHALDFEFARTLARAPDLEAVSFGTVGLAWGAGLHDYKLRLGYEVLPRNWVIQLHPKISPILTSKLVTQLLKAARRLRPHDQRLERISAVLGGARLSRQNVHRDSDATAIFREQVLSKSGR
jgi:hypothetical protein